MENQEVRNTRWRGVGEKGGKKGGEGKNEQLVPGSLQTEIMPPVFMDQPHSGPLGAGKVILNLPRAPRRSKRSLTSSLQGVPTPLVRSDPMLLPNSCLPPLELNEEEEEERSWFGKVGR